VAPRPPLRPSPRRRRRRRTSLAKPGCPDLAKDEVKSNVPRAPWYNSSEARIPLVEIPAYGWESPLKPVTQAFGLLRTYTPLEVETRSLTERVSDFVAGIVLVKTGMIRGSTPSNIVGWDYPPYLPSKGVERRMRRLLFDNSNWYRTIWLGSFKDFLTSPPGISTGLSERLRRDKLKALKVPELAGVPRGIPKCTY